MFYTNIERLEADFNLFYVNTIKEALTDCGGDLEAAEELVEDAWVDKALGEGYKLHEIVEAL